MSSAQRLRNLFVLQHEEAQSPEFIKWFCRIEAVKTAQQKAFVKKKERISA